MLTYSQGQSQEKYCQAQIHIFLHGVKYCVILSSYYKTVYTPCLLKKGGTPPLHILLPFLTGYGGKIDGFFCI